MLLINKKVVFCRSFLFTFLCLRELINIIISYIPTMSFLASFSSLMKMMFLIAVLYKTFNKCIIKLGLVTGVFIASLGISCFFHIENTSYVGDFFSNYCTSIVPMCLIICYINDSKKFLEYAKIPSEITCICACIMPYTSMYTTTSNTGREIFLYMTVGYGSLLCWTIVAYQAITYKKVVDIVIMIITVVNYVLYANRGVLLCTFAYLIFCLYENTKMFGKVGIFTVAIIVSFYIYNNFYELVRNISIMLSIHGITSRTLLRLLNKQFATDYARMGIYKRCLQWIKENPLGAGIGYDRVINGGAIGQYAHNLELEILIQFGVVVGSLIIIFIFFSFIYMLFIKGEREIRDLFMVFFIPSIIQLQMSGSIFLSYQLPTALFIFMFVIAKRYNWSLNKQEV